MSARVHEEPSVFAKRQMFVEDFLLALTDVFRLLGYTEKEAETMMAAVATHLQLRRERIDAEEQKAAQ